MKIEFGIKM